MGRLTKRNDVTAYVNCDNCPSKGNCNIPQSCLETLSNKLAAYEDAEEQGRLIVLPCKIGDKVRDKIADYVFTVEQIEFGHKAGTLFRCGNPGTKDYMAFYDFEIGDKIEVFTREESEKALEGMK